MIEKNSTFGNNCLYDSLPKSKPFQIYLLNKQTRERNKKSYLCLTEGFGGKRAVGFLLKIELCQKCSKFCM